MRRQNGGYRVLSDGGAVTVGYQTPLQGSGSQTFGAPALRELATELRMPRHPLTDYLRRRQALQEWALNTSTWEALVSELPPIPGPIRPVVDDRKRKDASIFAWTQVTCGEHLFAPRPIEARQPSHLQREWAQRRNTTWFQLTRPNPLRHYADLRKALTHYARQLARDIDAGRPPAN
jgi:hypothetical protein